MPRRNNNAPPSLPALPGVGIREWLEDWQKRYDAAEAKWEDAKWARYEAQLKEDRLARKVFLLRREYKAAKSSNVEVSRSHE